jgi:hypothetical protein
MSVAPELGGGPKPVWRRSLTLPGVSRHTLVSVCGLGLLAAFVFRGPLLGSGVFFERDIHMMWFGQVESLVRSVAQSSWPVWDPWIGFGRPLWANPNNQVLYPPTWLNLLMRPWTYYVLFVVLHSLFSAVGLFALARRLGVSHGGAFLSAAVWTATGPWLSLVSVWNHLSGAAWIPWALLAADAALASSGVGHALLWGVALAAPLLAGSPDLFVMIVLCGTLWALLRLERPLRRAPGNRRIARSWLIALLFALGLAAGQWIPSFELARESARWSSAVGARTAWSLHPLGLLEVWLPFRFADLPLLPALMSSLLEFRAPWLRSIYLGAPCVALVAATLAAPRRGSRFFGLLGVGAVLMALGRHFPGYELAVGLFPPLGVLRFPVKAMILAAFCWSLLAGMGFDVWRQSTALPRRRWHRSVSVPLTVVLCLCGGAALLAGFGAESWGPQLLSRGPGSVSYAQILGPTATRLAIGAGLGAIALVLAVVRVRGAACGALALAMGALSLGDLLVSHDGLNPLAPQALYTDRPAVLDHLEQDGRERVYVHDHAVTPKAYAGRPRRPHPFQLARAPEGWSRLAALHLGVQTYLNPPAAGRFGVQGSYDLDLLDLYPAWLGRLTERLREVEGSPAHLRLLQVGNVTTALALLPEPWWERLTPVTTLPGLFELPIHVMRVPDPLPRTYAVGEARFAEGEDALATLVAPDFDPWREVILAEGPARGRPAEPVGPFSGRSLMVESGADHVLLEAELSQAGYVVLVDGYDPGWRATVDGRSVPVLRANVGFRAVAVPRGHHVIEYRYRPPSVAVGLGISGLTLLLGLGLCVRSPKA